MRLLLALVLISALGASIYFAVEAGRPSGRTVLAGGWPVSMPGSEGFDAPRLARALRRIENREGSILALLVARHGRLVVERYYHGYDRTSGFDVYSITKSVTSALVGVALAEHRIKNVDEPLADTLSHDIPPGADRRTGRIILRELLTMTAGWPGDADPRNDIGDARNIVRALLRRPIVHQPGSTFAYDTPSSHLLSAVISRATGTSEEVYAREHLFGPLRIALADYWPKDDQGTTYGGTGLTLVARDAAKLGQLYLQRGRWHGRRLVPRAWVAESTRPQVSLGDGRGYGYDWWTLKQDGLSEYLALGYGGQMVAVVPKLDLVVAVFSNPSGEEVDLERLVFDEIAPAAHR
jgi:CubicO group peptidase (beta-lactamase class C family)